jgi:hypothetical protein
MIDAENRINRALTNYKNGIDMVNAGWDILRYAKQGRVNINCPSFDKVFMDWYPNNPDYIMLRMAKAGKLSYKKSYEDELQDLKELETV